MKIVFFDGYCSLCNTFVDWLMHADKAAQLKFASLQGETAAKLLGQTSEPSDSDTIIYLKDGERFERSTAVLRLMSDMGGAWILMRALLIIPPFIRDCVYRLIAKNRYRFMKKRETCRMPTPAERDRLLQ